MAIPRLLAQWLLATALLIPRGAAQTTAANDDPNHGVVFIYPTKDQIYNYMDTVNVTYTSPFPTPNLFTFCNPNAKQISMQRAIGYNATIPYILNFTSASNCWFNLRPGTQAGFGANSPTFNIIGQERGSGSQIFGPDNTPTVSPPSSTQTPAGGSGSGSGGGGGAGVGANGNGDGDGRTGTAGNVNDGGNNNSTTGATGGSGMSGAASAGIGVGVGVGVLALGVGGFIWWWKKRGAQRLGQQSQAPGGGSYEQSGNGGTPAAYSDADKYFLPEGHRPSPPLQVHQEMGDGHGMSEIGSSGRPGKFEMPG
ncbi:hypothetical protein B0T16DRAFT_337 [Cercophora newfieldiana]|uniref:Uncharacterized protein n=1 Tax=Cercophora newfieldiana TaxID=92897 RepID=A0AA40CZA9_9PEZI|nr:hypothetical protein B0T16DRAFT_337 [Cercophora newfieldiana]